MGNFAARLICGCPFSMNRGQLLIGERVNEVDLEIGTRLPLLQDAAAAERPNTAHVQMSTVFRQALLLIRSQSFSAPRGCPAIPAPSLLGRQHRAPSFRLGAVATANCPAFPSPILPRFHRRSAKRSAVGAAFRRLIQRGTKCFGNLCRHRRQCQQAGVGRLTVEHKSARGRPLGGGKLQRQRSVRSVRFFH